MTRHLQTSTTQEFTTQCIVATGVVKIHLEILYPTSIFIFKIPYSYNDARLNGMPTNESLIASRQSS